MSGAAFLSRLPSRRRLGKAALRVAACLLMLPVAAPVAEWLSPKAVIWPLLSVCSCLLALAAAFAGFADDPDARPLRVGAGLIAAFLGASLFTSYPMRLEDIRMWAVCFSLPMAGALLLPKAVPAVLASAGALQAAVMCARLFWHVGTFRSGGVERAGGLFFALDAGLLMSLALAACSEPFPAKRRTPGFGLAFAASLAGLVLQWTRLNWLALACGSAAAALRSRSPRKILLPLLCLGLLAATFWMRGSSAVSQESTSRSNWGHWSAWNAAWKAGLDTFPWGIGLGRQAVTVIHSDSTAFSASSKSLLLWGWSELGLGGVAAVVLLLGGGLRWACSARAPAAALPVWTALVVFCLLDQAAFGFGRVGGTAALGLLAGWAMAPEKAGVSPDAAASAALAGGS